MLIGLSCDFETIVDTRGCPAPRFLSPEAYANAVAAAGGTPILMPHAAAEHVPELIANIAGLVITGGNFDVPPHFYGQAARPGLGPLLEARSEFERCLCRAALERDLPLLGVCGGMQLLNVVCGGTLHQDLSERPATLQHVQPQDRRQPHHPVTLVPGSRLAGICATLELAVNSTHHQVVANLGTGIQAVGMAPDGVVEAIEVPGARFTLGVQWHPEALAAPAQAAIYRALVAAAGS